MKSIDDLWKTIARQPYPILTSILDPQNFEKMVPDEVVRVRLAAENSMACKVDILGSGERQLDIPMKWTTDFKNNAAWPMSFFRDINVQDKGRTSDIKVPWELSRLQWLTPVGQSYLLDPDEKYAAFVKSVIEDWISVNPYARGPNWAITMEPAMRVFTWTWFFHIFKNSISWSDPLFQSKFLAGLYEHGVFCRRYLEDFGINGNHLTANAGALVFLAEFFPTSINTQKWGTKGWQILVSEIFKQVDEDGVDFEGSSSYHRMVSELFLWPALYRRTRNKGVSELYFDRLRKMGKFIEAYTGYDGRAPLWGDGDDGRPFCFGAQEPRHHGYLPALISLAIDNKVLFAPPEYSIGEIVWSLGESAWSKAAVAPNMEMQSFNFSDSGYFVMAGGGNKVFIDCASVGFGGRGGHGHNDCLSFDANLASVSVISDSGTFVYSENFKARNEFRSTSYHNTPQIDGEEMNRFLGPEDLFSLSNDAVPELRAWKTVNGDEIFSGSHSGYERLSPGLRPVRTIILDKSISTLLVHDVFEGEGEHAVSIPYHLGAGAVINCLGRDTWQLNIEGSEFLIYASPIVDWTAQIESGWISERYGNRIERPILSFKRIGALKGLRLVIGPSTNVPDDLEGWVAQKLKSALNG